MKYKVNELDGALLDAAVAKAEGWRYEIAAEHPAAGGVARREAFCLATVPDLEHGDGSGLVGFYPSSSWDDGGPIIERERINLTFRGDRWRADIEPARLPWGGETPLIAAMRAYVASKFGDEIDLP